MPKTTGRRKIAEIKKLALLLPVSVAAILVVCSFLLFPNSGGQRNTGKLIIRDMTGRKVVVPDDVKRVVTAMYPIATQLMFLVGAQEMLAAISDMDVNDAMVNIYPPITSIYRPVMTNNGDIKLRKSSSRCIPQSRIKQLI